MQYTKDIPFGKTYDLIVCGGGMTGFAAAVSASRRGLKTALIEARGVLGGVATAGGVNHLLGGRVVIDGQKTKPSNIGGLFDEITNILIRNGDAIEPDTIDVNHNPHGWIKSLAGGIPFDERKMKLLLDRFCVDNKVDVYFFTNCIDVTVTDNIIENVICHNKSGLFALQSRYFIDATGDADIAFLAGCPTVLGTEDEHLTALVSLSMKYEHVDYKQLADYICKHNSPRLKELLEKLRSQGNWPFPSDGFVSVMLTEPDIFFVNMNHLRNVNGTDGKSISQAMVAGRKQADEMFEVIRKYIPGFANSRMLSVADVPGVRETRRIVGEFILTVSDVIDSVDYDDCIAISSYVWDLTNPKTGKQPEHKPIKDGFTRIPYRTLLPKNVSNLLVAGRAISVERDVLGPIRVMGPCMAMGQAAGLATVCAYENNTAFSEIHIDDLHSLQSEDKCIYNVKQIR